MFIHIEDYVKMLAPNVTSENSMVKEITIILCSIYKIVHIKQKRKLSAQVLKYVNEYLLECMINNTDPIIGMDEYGFWEIFKNKDKVILPPLPNAKSYGKPERKKWSNQ